MAAKQGSTNLPAAASHEAAGDVEPKFELIDNATNYVLRLNLRGFNKDDFRVQVDDAGRLTVRGQRPAAAGKHAPPPRFHKVFQLPSNVNLDDISGRFNASVLTLTVPKCAATGAATPTTIEEIRKPNACREDGAKPPPKDLDGAEKKEADVVKPKEEINKALDEATRKAQHKEDALKKAMDEATRKVQPKEEDDSKRRKKEQEQEQEQKQTPMPAVRKDEVKPKAPEAAAAPAKKPAAKPEEVAGEKAKAVDRESLAGRGKVIDPKSLAERVRRRGEEERAKAAAAAEEAEREKKTACGGWKERVAGELTDMKWAGGLVEMATNNKEVVTAAIAAFSLALFVSHKLFSRK